MKAILEKAMPAYSKSLLGNEKVSSKISSVEIIGFASPTYKGKYVDPKNLDEDARKAVNMFHQVKVPVLGMVENMSYLIAPQSKERIDVFGHGAGKKTAEVMNVPFLGELALIPEIRKGGDSGKPVSLEGPASELAAGFYAVAKQVEARCAEVNKVTGPTMTVSD